MHLLSQVQLSTLWSKTHHLLIGFLCQALTYYLSSRHRKSSFQTPVKRGVRSFQHFAKTLLFSTRCLVTACVQKVSRSFPVLICLALGTQLPVLSHRQALPVQQGLWKWCLSLTKTHYSDKLHARFSFPIVICYFFSQWFFLVFDLKFKHSFLPHWL